MLVPTTGQLLVATPVLSDPNFDRTIVFMLEHSEDGGLGVVVNRPSDTTVGEAVPELAWVSGADEIIYVGGPVSPEVALAVVQSPDDTEGFSEVIHGIGTLELGDDLSEPRAGVQRGRLFSGYSGWGSGQLEAELSAGAWFTADVDPDDLFTPDPDGLWERVLRRQPGELAWFANFPPAPEMN